MNRKATLILGIVLQISLPLKLYSASANQNSRCPTAVALLSAEIAKEKIGNAWVWIAPGGSHSTAGYIEFTVNDPTERAELNLPQGRDFIRIYGIHGFTNRKGVGRALFEELDRTYPNALLVGTIFGINENRLWENINELVDPDPSKSQAAAMKIPALALGRPFRLQFIRSENPAENFVIAIRYPRSEGRPFEFLNREEFEEELQK